MIGTHDTKRTLRVGWEVALPAAVLIASSSVELLVVISERPPRSPVKSFAFGFEWSAIREMRH